MRRAVQIQSRRLPFQKRLMGTNDTAALSNADPIQRKLMEEMCIVVDEMDNVLGPDTKKNCHFGKGRLHRAFSVFLFNSENKLLMQQRAAEKITFPSYWANTCCSHPLHVAEEMETKDHLGVKRAAARKLDQELGIPSTQYSLDEYHFLGRILYQAPSGDSTWCEHELDHILLLKGDPKLDDVNPNEVAKTKFLGRQELESFLNDEANLVSPWFRMIATSLLPKWWEQLDTITSDTSDKTIHRYY